MNNISYNWSDAWVLLAIINASRKGDATLTDIIASGDAINFAVFAPEVLESGLARLTEGGYIEETNGIFRPTKAALAYAKNSSKRRPAHKELKDVEAMLGAPTATAKQPSANDLRYPGFSAAMYEDAVTRYVQSD